MKISNDVITSTITTHTATRIPRGWVVTWLGDRTVTGNQAVTAMLLAELAELLDQLDGPAKQEWARVHAWAAELGLTGVDAVELILGPKAHRTA